MSDMAAWQRQLNLADSARRMSLALPLSHSKALILSPYLILQWQRCLKSAAPHKDYQIDVLWSGLCDSVGLILHLDGISKTSFSFISTHCVGGGFQALLDNLLNLPLELEAASVQSDPNPCLLYVCNPVIPLPPPPPGFVSQHSLLEGLMSLQLGTVRHFKLQFLLKAGGSSLISSWVCSALLKYQKQCTGSEMYTFKLNIRTVNILGLL